MGLDITEGESFVRKMDRSLMIRGQNFLSSFVMPSSISNTNGLCGIIVLLLRNLGLYSFRPQGIGSIRQRSFTTIDPRCLQP